MPPASAPPVSGPLDATSQKILWEYVERVKATAPVVHNITNYVAMQTVANSLLAFGASPIMAHAQEEMEDITRISSALVVNIGTLSPTWIESMRTAIKAANVKNIPVVIDPVGAGASTLRTKTSLMLMDLADCLLVRGNPSEIMALAGVVGASRGVDSMAASEQACDAADAIARRYQCTVCASGAVDIVSNGEKRLFLYGGSPLMPRVTALGCTASAMVGAFAGVLMAPDCSAAASIPGVPAGKPDVLFSADVSLAATGADAFVVTAERGPSEIPVMASQVTGQAENTATAMNAVAAAMAVMSAAGAKAGLKASGPGSFLPEFLDALYLITPEDFEKEIHVMTNS